MENIDLNRKVFMAKSFLDSAIFHEKTLDLNIIPTDQINSLEEIKIDSRFRRKLVTHFLYSMVFELSIKIIWGIEQSTDAPYHHNIWGLYKDLSKASQQKISDMYDAQVSHTKHLISQCNGQIDSEGNVVNIVSDMQSLKEALKANEQTVKNFKYDGQFNGKSSALCSLIWDSDEIYVLPKATANAITFPKALLEYAISLKS
jgi:hypothetical protein